MPEIIDTLAPAYANLDSFTVNNLVDFVTVAPGAATPYAGNRLGGYIFTKGDSFRLLSCGWVLPESFTFYRDVALNTPLAMIDIIPWGVTTGQAYTNPGFSGGGQYIPFENFECVSDNFFNCKDAINTVDPSKNLFYENFRLQVYSSLALKISMLGVPDELNGKSFKITPFVKVLHTIALA